MLFSQLAAAPKSYGYQTQTPSWHGRRRPERVRSVMESCAFIRELDFTPNAAVFDAAFSEKN